MHSLFIFQAMSCCSCLSLVFMLALCPFKTQRNVGLDMARYCYMGSIAMLVLQFLVQMIFGFRANNILQGVACNMVFIYPITQLIIMSTYYLLRLGGDCEKEWWQSALLCLFNLVVIGCGLVVNDGAWLRHFIYFTYAVYVIENLIYIVRQSQEYRQMKPKYIETFGEQAFKKMKWMRVYMVSRLGLIFSMLVMLQGNVASLIYGIVVFFCLAYFVAKMMYFSGIIYALESGSETNKKNVQTPLEQLLNDWVETEGYCQSDVTLASLAKTLGVSRAALSQHMSVKLQTPFHDWLGNQRAEHAKRLIMANPNDTLEHVSALSGFSNRSYFDVVFKDKTGVTPAVFRRNILANRQGYIN